MLDIILNASSITINDISTDIIEDHLYIIYENDNMLYQSKIHYNYFNLALDIISPNIIIYGNTKYIKYINKYLIQFYNLDPLIQKSSNSFIIHNTRCSKTHVYNILDLSIGTYICKKVNFSYKIEISYKFITNDKYNILYEYDNFKLNKPNTFMNILKTELKYTHLYVNIYRSITQQNYNYNYIYNILSNLETHYNIDNITTSFFIKNEISYLSNINEYSIENIMKLNKLEDTNIQHNTIYILDNIEKSDNIDKLINERIKLLTKQLNNHNLDVYDNILNIKQVVIADLMKLSHKINLSYIDKLIYMYISIINNINYNKLLEQIILDYNIQYSPNTLIDIYIQEKKYYVQSKLNNIITRLNNYEHKFQKNKDVILNKYNNNQIANNDIISLVKKHKIITAEYLYLYNYYKTLLSREIIINEDDYEIKKTKDKNTQEW